MIFELNVQNKIIPNGEDISIFADILKRIVRPDDRDIIKFHEKRGVSNIQYHIAHDEIADIMINKWGVKMFFRKSMAQDDCP